VGKEKNPPGDIPDSQVFVSYRPPSSLYEVKVPEGWARTANGDDVRFADKLDAIGVTVVDAPAAPTAATARDTQAAQMAQAARAGEVSKVQDVTLPVGPAVLVVYTANSDPN